MSDVSSGRKDSNWKAFFIFAILKTSSLNHRHQGPWSHLQMCQFRVTTEEGILLPAPPPQDSALQSTRTTALPSLRLCFPTVLNSANQNDSGKRKAERKSTVPLPEKWGLGSLQRWLFSALFCGHGPGTQVAFSDNRVISQFICEKSPGY